MSTPLLKGGQGRSSHSVRSDATSVMFTLLLALIVGGALLARALGWVA